MRTCNIGRVKVTDIYELKAFIELNDIRRGVCTTTPREFTNSSMLDFCIDWNYGCPVIMYHVWFNGKLVNALDLEV